MAGSFRSDTFDPGAFETASALVSGTTLAALQTGSLAFKYVVAIEGYPYLLTNASTTAAVNAWSSVSGGDWTQALGGLFVEIDNQQTLHPWEPFQGGGTCTLRIAPDAADTFGIDAHRTQFGPETFLTATTNRSATSIAVRRSDDFSAAPAEAYIGTECIGYSAKPDTNHFTASPRGKYSPFAAGGTGSPRFAEHHRVGIADNGVQLEPAVTQHPRSWIGKWVGVWMHKTDGTNLNLQSNALCVFAGTIAEVRDDPQTLTTAIQVKHVLDTIKDVTIGRDMWSGTLAAGVYLATGMQFTMVDNNYEGTNADLTANPLVVVASGATGANQVNAGTYTADVLCSIITSWLASESAAARLYGSYTLITPDPYNQRTVMHYYMTKTGAPTSTITGWWLTFPTVNIANFLGYNDITVHSSHNDSNTPHADSSPNQPQGQVVWSPDQNNFGFTASIASSVGTIVEQYSQLPAAFRTGLPNPEDAASWGVFLFDEKILIVARYDSGTNTLTEAYLAPSLMTGGVGLAGVLDNYRLAVGNALPKIRQVFVTDGTFATLMKQFIMSTGTSGYNDATYDTIPYNFAIGVPAGLLASFAQSCDLMPGALAKMLVVVDKPTKFSEQFGADFVLRRAHLVWKNGGLQLVSWATPSSSAPSLVLLPESTKAEPSGNNSPQRTATTLDPSNMQNMVKLAYNRDFTQYSGGAIGGEVYASFLNLEDPISVDDQGGQGKVMTLNCRNSYSQYADTGVGIEQLAVQFLVTFPIFARPIRKITRSIDSRYYEGLAIGDFVSVTDTFARDPKTGKRGVSSRPGLVVHHRASFGGFTAGSMDKPTDPQGEIEVMFMDVDRTVAYAPAAQVDETQNAGGFLAGYNGTTHVIRTYAHQHSEASEAADAANFAANDKIFIVEIDPALGAAGLSWERTIQSVSGNDITLTAALSSPAWDSTKRYRIMSDTYDLAQASQQAKAYQAGSDGTIKQLAPPDQYGMITSAILATTFDHTTLPELIPPTAYQANVGRPRDCAYDRAISLLLENLMDHKTARQSPSLFTTVMENTSYSSGNGWQLVYMEPLFVSQLLVDMTTLNRWLYVAPFFRSSTGAATSIRVTLAGKRVTNTTINDVTLPAPSASNTWNTSSSTWGTGAEAAFPLGMFNGYEVIWILVECKLHCQCMGLAQLIERERIAV